MFLYEDDDDDKEEEEEIKSMTVKTNISGEKI